MMSGLLMCRMLRLRNIGFWMAAAATMTLLAITACGGEAAPSEIEAGARKLLEDEVGEGDFSLTSSAGMQWSDASLGCPEEGFAYAQVITPGYKLVFDLAGVSYPVHTNADGSHMVICREGQ